MKEPRSVEEWKDYFQLQARKRGHWRLIDLEVYFHPAYRSLSGSSKDALGYAWTQVKWAKTSKRPGNADNRRKLERDTCCLTSNALAVLGITSSATQTKVRHELVEKGFLDVEKTGNDQNATVFRLSWRWLKYPNGDYGPPKDAIPIGRPPKHPIPPGGLIRKGESSIQKSNRAASKSESREPDEYSIALDLETESRNPISPASKTESIILIPGLESSAAPENTVPLFRDGSGILGCSSPLPVPGTPETTLFGQESHSQPDVTQSQLHMFHITESDNEPQDDGEYGVVTQWQFPAKLIAMAEKHHYGHCKNAAFCKAAPSVQLEFTSGLTVKIRPRSVEVNGVTVAPEWVRLDDGRLVQNDGLEDYLARGGPSIYRYGIDPAPAAQKGEAVHQ